jgi:outer membrane immunogenic protein
MEPHVKTFSGPIAFALLAVFATPSFAADLPMGVVEVPVPEEIADAHDWNGPYAGIFGGGAWGQTRATDIGSGGGFFLDPNEVITANTSGYAVGITAGANWQQGNFLLGVEGDLGYLGLKGSNFSTTNRGATLTTEGGPFVTLRGRAGIALDNLLLFGTAGLMAANLNSSLDSGIGAPFPTDSSGWQLGWTAGVGAELALDDTWSIKGEYLYYDLGSSTVYADPVPPTATFDVKHTGSILRIGLNAAF